MGLSQMMRLDVKKRGALLQPGDGQLLGGGGAHRDLRPADDGAVLHQLLRGGAARWRARGLHGVPRESGGENPLYTGNFCLGGAPTYRNLGGRQFITETGRARVLLNRPFVPDGLGGLLPILPGETWYFQSWSYDPGATPSTGFSDALGVTFTLF